MIYFKVYIFRCVFIGQIHERPQQSNTLDGSSSKQSRERNAVQQGGQLENTAEELVIVVESALQSTISVYQKLFNQEAYWNLFEKLKTDLTELYDIAVKKFIVEMQALKWYVTLKLNFHKANNPSVITTCCIQTTGIHVHKCQRYRGYASCCI